MSNKFLSRNITIGDVDDLQSTLNNKLDKNVDGTITGNLSVSGDANITGNVEGGDIIANNDLYVSNILEMSCLPFTIISWWTMGTPPAL
jgi:hypothetical protein